MGMTPRKANDLLSDATPAIEKDAKPAVPPISRPPARHPAVPPLEFARNSAVFAALTVYSAVSIVLLQLPAVALMGIPYVVWPAVPQKSREALHRWFYRLYKTYIRWTGSAFGSCIIILMNILAPYRLVVSGNLNLMEQATQTIVMANHQIYPDWCYLWALAHRTRHHGDVKIMLMAVLQYLPIFGIGMTFLEFIFLKRKLSADRRTILSHLRRIKNNPELPLWLLIFPEGTLNTPNNRETSRAFAKKNDIADDPQIVLLPKATGLFMCCDALTPKVNQLFDVTVSYGGLALDQIPYEEYLPENVFMKKQYPREVHMHVQVFDVTKLPGFDGKVTMQSLNADKDALARAEKQAAKTDGAFDAVTEARRSAFSDWVRERFMVKDRLMDRFYRDGKFPETEVGVDNPVSLPQESFHPVPQPLDWIVLAILWVSTLYTLPIYGGICWRILSLFF